MRQTVLEFLVKELRVDFRGVFENGVVRPLERVVLAPGTEVDCHPVVPSNGSREDSRFWENHSVETLAREQGVAKVSSVDDLRGDWPPDESLEEFLEELRRFRR
jgi:predicted DNA-binding antitoxin AbrB/MazE fold protein